MMTPEDTKKFETMINNNQFTQESYDKLLNRFSLTNIDLESEYTKIIKKESALTRRQRDLIPDFLAVRDMLKAKKEKDEKKEPTENLTTEAADKIIEEKIKTL